MSCFIVNNETIDKIVTYIRDNDNAAFTRRQISERCGLPVFEPSGPAELGREMLRLNARAYGQRYTRGAAVEAPRYTYATPAKIVTDLSALKALRCFLYQCDEGDACETELYKVLDALANSIAMEIIRRMPEYDALPWG